MSVASPPAPTPRRAPAHERGVGTFLRGSRAGLFVLALLVGLGAGLGAIVFRELVDGITWITTGHSEFGQGGHVASAHLRWLGLPFYVVIPAVGGLLYGPLVYRFAREARGHGVPEVMVAVADRGGRIRPQVAVVKALASALTIGTGGSVGREGPIVQIGSAMASTLGQWVRTPDSRLRILVACGAGGGIAATFNAPITGVFFAVEIILRELAGEALFAIMLSAMVADAVAIPVLGNHAFLEQFPVHAALHHSTTYLLVAVLAAVAAVVGQVSRVVLYAIEDVCDRLWRGKAEWARPIAGGLVVGLVLLAVPQLFGVGYPVMFKALDGGYAAWFLLVLLLGKIVATSLTLGFGGSGGVFAPSLFVGLMTGMLYGVGVDHVFGAPAAGSPALYAAVGMAGVFGSSTRAPLTALASVVEMTGDYALTLPVMLTVGIATVVARGVSYGTIYTTKLLRRGQDIERTAPWRAFAGLTAHDVMRISRQPVEVPASRPSTDLPHDLARVVARREPHGVFATESVTEVLRHLQTEGRDAVPVLSENGHYVIGWATRHTVLNAVADRVAVRTAPDADRDPGRSTLPHHVVIEVEHPPSGPQRRLGDLTWPAGYVPVALTRNGRYREARPEIELRPGDVIGLLARD